MPQNSRMAKRKNPSPHKGKLVRINPRIIEVIDDLAQENATDRTEEVNRAIRETLKREGKWPPARSGGDVKPDVEVDQ